MLSVKGKKLILASTPKGKNYIYDLYLKGLEENNNYKSFRFKSEDNPYSNKKVIELAKQNFPLKLYQQEYEGLFLDSVSIFQNIEEVSIMKQYNSPLPNERYYGGIDIGMLNDFTVFILLNEKREMVYMDRFTNIESPQLKERLLKTINLFKPVKIYIEKNNQGLPIFQDLRQSNVNKLESFETTSESKPRIINNLIHAFSNKEIKIINDNIIKEELNAYEMKFNESGKIKFSSPTHDDCVMSLAIAYECLNKHKFDGRYVFGTL